mmetsp:Transcript_185/g.189  ORF Transcript_185/g.189 Transcript_185/m.189 type:complete len:216 (-) Transcript_185:186-833(-)
MGFDYSINVSVLFGVEFEIPDNLDWSKFAKRLEEYEPSESLLRRAARAIPKRKIDDLFDLPEDIAESARTEISVMATYNSNGEDDEDKDEARWNFNFDMLGQKALDKVLGKGNGLELKFCLDTGNQVLGDADYPATRDKIFLVHSESEIKSQQKELTCGGRGWFNVPWGCLSTPIPTKLEDHDDIVSKIQRVLTDLGLQSNNEPSWLFVSIASGG